MRVKAEVDADQEITIIQHRVLAAGGPALLFEQVKGSPYRLVSNLYGTPERVRMVFGRDPLEIGEDNLVIARDDGKGIYGTGHNWVIQVPGKDEWYIVYHRFNYPKGIAMGDSAGYHREVCIDKMAFDSVGRIIQATPTHEGINPVK